MGAVKEETAVKETTDLVSLPSQETALSVFQAEKGLDPYLQAVRAQVDDFLKNPPALDTVKGRQAYASMAYKIVRSKTAIDSVGKTLVAELKELPKQIDAERKRWRDVMDQWREEVRQPLTDWETAEEARKAQHESRITALHEWGNPADDLNTSEIRDSIARVEGVEIGPEWEEYEAEAARAKDKALANLRDALTRREQYEAEQAELARLRAEAEAREQREREERIAREAAEKARLEAEQRAQAEKDAAARRELEVRLAAEQREREHQLALTKARQEAEAERQRIEAEHQRKEQERLAEERRLQQEAAQRQADKEHRATINRGALQAMVAGGMSVDCAKQAITLIARGQVPGVVIQY